MAGCITAVTLWTELIEQGVHHWVAGHPTFEPSMPPRIHRLLQLFGPLSLDRAGIGPFRPDWRRRWQTLAA